jgi:cytidylate kinase
MSTQKDTIQGVVENQIRKWQARGRPGSEAPRMPVVTVSRQAGSGGLPIAQGIARELDLDFFDQDTIEAIADNPAIGTLLLESLDEKKMNALEEWAASVILQRSLWPDEYLQQLFQVIGTIGIHGRAIIVGMGAHYILPLNQTFRLRLFASQGFRAERLAEQQGLSINDAKRQLLNIDSDREAFARKHFHQKIADPLNYDMVINTGTVTACEAIEAVCCVLQGRL